MKSVPKLIRRFVGILLVSSVLLIFLNLVLLAVFTAKQVSNSSPWITAMEAAEAIEETENGYIMSEDMTAELAENDIWAVFIDNSTLKAVWKTGSLPDTVPLEYTASGIANLTRGYIDGYPTFTGESEKGLMVLGYPQKSFWKHMWPSWDYNMIANMPKIVVCVLLINIAIIFVIYAATNSKLIKSIGPITNGIQALPTGEPVCIREKGLLSDVAANINRTSEILQSQNYQLRKRDTARANWIAGVSHDIRTPLSVVMGYAGQLQGDANLTEDQRKKASVILKQSERMRNLINDLNLATKLEYDMQPANKQRENAVAIVRQVVVDFMNTDIYGKYPIEWKTEEKLRACTVTADRDLLKRAVSNLIQNSINHNVDGCTIYVSVRSERGKCFICVEDDGVGASDEQIASINNAPHYMFCDTNAAEQRHGLGLLIVKQIAVSLGGSVSIGHSLYGGFSVEIALPL